MESDESLRDRVYAAYRRETPMPSVLRYSLDVYDGEQLDGLAFIYGLHRKTAASDPFGDAVRAAQQKADAETKGYVPEKHDSFDADHIWAVTMETA